MPWEITDGVDAPERRKGKPVGRKNRGWVKLGDVQPPKPPEPRWRGPTQSDLFQPKRNAARGQPRMAGYAGTPCAYCGTPMTAPTWPVPAPTDASRDHAFPKSAGALTISMG